MPTVVVNSNLPNKKECQQWPWERCIWFKKTTAWNIEIASCIHTSVHISSHWSLSVSCGGAHFSPVFLSPHPLFWELSRRLRTLSSSPLAASLAIVGRGEGADSPMYIVALGLFLPPWRMVWCRFLEASVGCRRAALHGGRCASPATDRKSVV